MRVLIFEDDALVRGVLVDLIETGGHVAVIGDLTFTAAQVQLRDTTYDLVVTDMQMPAFSGAEVLQWVRQTHPGTPVVAVTGVSPPNLRQMGIDQKAFSAILTKPFRDDEFLLVIANAHAHLRNGH